jgi:hypothetical protein
VVVKEKDNQRYLRFKKKVETQIKKEQAAFHIM